MVVRSEGPDGVLSSALGTDLKGKLSPVIYITGILLCLVNPKLGLVPYVIVAIMWLVPDRRLEHAILAREQSAA
jgi:hypothetical protein